MDLQDLYQGLFFDSYDWRVIGGTFSNGGEKYISYDRFDNSANVTWSNDPREGKGLLTCIVHTGGNDFFAQLEPWIYAVAQPGRIQEADANGNIVVIAGTTTQTCTSSDSRGWWVTEYQWTFSPVGGTDVTFSTSTPVAALSLSGIEYGQISIVAYNYRCDQTSVARTANIVRKLASPTWISYDEVMCNNTTSSFTINSAYATSFYWVATGGFEIWNGSSYVTSLLTTSTSVTVKSRSTNGGGSVSVTAKRVGSNVLDSEPLIKDRSEEHTSELQSH